MVFAFVLLSVLFGLGAGQQARAADPVVAAVGDMACPPTDPSYNSGNGTSSRCRQRYVSDLVVNAAPAGLLDLGDNQYTNGELANYQAVYHPTFGRSNAVVYPSLGNAEYNTVDAQGFFNYFSSVGVTARIGSSGADASHFANGYYSFDIGSWHLIALNSNCPEGTVGGCGTGSTQETWLKNDLAAHPNRCTLAYWHHPRWNSGSLGNDNSTAAFWTDLYNAHADLVLNGHGNHHYERFLSQSPSGNPDTNGVREFIVSTGGESHGTPPGTPGDPTTSQTTNYTSYGILKLTLHATSYDWQFVPEVGGSFTDSGSGFCHSTAAAQAPAAPSLSASAGNNSVHLSWSAPADGGSAITGYKVYRGTTAGGETLLKSVGNVTSTDDNTAVNGTKYYYRVSAVNSIGEGAQSNEVSATPTATPAFPRTGVLDSFARAAGGLGSNWQSPGLQDAGTVTIASSGLTKSSSAESSATWSPSTFGADQEAYLTVPTLPSGGNFIQVAGRVSTLSSSGVSCYFLRVTPSSSTWDLREKLNGNTSTSIATFTAPLAAGDGMGLQLVGSTITAYRKPGSGAWTSVGSATDTTIPGAGYVSFTLGDTAMRGGAFGGGTIVAAQAPSAPVLSATAGNGSVHLSWTAPADGGVAITNYKVYRGTAAGAETLLATLGNVTSYDDSTAGNGTKYFYRVAAVNGVGEGSQSNEVSATPVPSISVDDVSHPEGNTGQTDFTFTVSLSGASTSPVTVDYATQDGTATTAGSDYAALTSTTLTFAAGQTSKTVTVKASGDTAFETDESFTLKLSNPAGATILDGSGLGTIQNDDAQPKISVDDVSHAEGDTGQTDFTFTVSLSNASYQQVQVSAQSQDGTATTAGSDYAALASTVLTFTPGQTSKTVTVKANGDTTFEPDETFTVALSTATGATILDGSGLGTIQNDDAQPKISVDDVSHAEGDTGQTDFTFTVSLSNPSAQAVTVDYATQDGTATTAGSDYTQATGTLSLAAGQTSKTVTVKANGDTTFEPDETFALKLTNPAGATVLDDTGAATIQNDDAQPSLSVNDVSVLEGDSGQSDLIFTVSLSHPGDGSVTADYATQDGTATTADADYDTAGGTLTFAAGEITKTVTVKVNGDAAIEADQSFVLVLSNPTGATFADDTGVGTIRNDDLSYARPKGATPVYASLVPTYQECTTPTNTHGGALVPNGSCDPVQGSSNLTVGTPDSDGAPAANFIGSVRLSVCASASCGGTDVAVKTSLSDVRCQSAETACDVVPNAGGEPDYTGELGLDLSVRLTDKNNVDTPGGAPEPGTVEDLTVPATIPCTATADLSTGGRCELSTTFNALVPGTLTAGARAIWQLGQVKVDDAGPDGALSTPDGTAPFAVQGVFVP